MTWYFAFNYDARAHSMALYQVLCKMGHKVEFIKVKRHADNEYNNRCDELARNAIKNL